MQTEWQAVNKVRDWRALLAHVAVYHIVVLGVLAARFGFQEAYVYAVVVILAITHVVLDRQRSVELLMKALRINVNRSSERWLLIVVDQSVHILLLGLAAFVLSRKSIP